MGDAAQLCDVPPVTHPVLVYDGVCGLCNHIVRWILRRDRMGLLRFASQQGQTGQALLKQHGISATGLDVVVLFEPGSTGVRVTAGARAILRVLPMLGLGYRLLALMLSVLPTAMLEWLYSAVAARRYRWFGKFDTCPAPSPFAQARFLD